MADQDGNFPTSNTETVNVFLAILNTLWHSRYEPGTILTVDETMLSGRVAGSLWRPASYLPSAQAPSLGLDAKEPSLCSLSGICLWLELAECKESMQGKVWAQQFGATCACILRLVEPYFNS